MSTPDMACARFGGEGACPEDALAPRSVEGGAIAAMLPILLAQWHPPGMGRAEFDMGTALRLAEAEGVPLAIAAVLMASVQSGVRRAQAMLSKQREDR